MTEDIEKGLVDEQRDEEQDYRVNRVVLVVARMSARLYGLLLPVYVLFMPLTIPRLSTYRHPPQNCSDNFFKFIATSVNCKCFFSR